MAALAAFDRAALAEQANMITAFEEVVSPPRGCAARGDDMAESRHQHILDLVLPRLRLPPDAITFQPSSQSNHSSSTITFDGMHDTPQLQGSRVASSVQTIVMGLYQYTRGGVTSEPRITLDEIPISLVLNPWYRHRALFLAGDEWCAAKLRYHGLTVTKVFSDAPAVRVGAYQSNHVIRSKYRILCSNNKDEFIKMTCWCWIDTHPS